MLFWHSLSPVSISTVRTEGPRPQQEVPDHSRRSERTGSLHDIVHEGVDSLHEGVDSLHEQLIACMNPLIACMNPLIG